MVLCVDDQTHGFSDDATVLFSAVQGMTELNTMGPVKIKVRSESDFLLVPLLKCLHLQHKGHISSDALQQDFTAGDVVHPVFITSVSGRYAFSIGDTSAFSEYERGGVVTEVKQPLVLKFVSLSILFIH